MSTFAECVVAPAYTEEALAVFNDSERFKLNKQIVHLIYGAGC